MLKISEIKNNARQSLSKKWTKALKIMLAFLLVEIIIGGIETIAILFANNKTIKAILLIFDIIIQIPLSLGLTFSFIKLKRNENVKTVEFIKLGILNFGKAWKIKIKIFFKLLLPILICVLLFSISLSIIVYSHIDEIMKINSQQSNLFIVIPFTLFSIIMIILIYIFIKKLTFSLAPYVAYDEPKATGKQLLMRSGFLIKNKLWKYIILNISFIGLAILSIFTFGIGFLWLIPYIEVANVCFYDEILKQV